MLPTTCAVCQDGLVINIIVATPSDLAPDGCELVEIMNDQPCDIGWAWDGEFGFAPLPELTDGD